MRSTAWVCAGTHNVDGPQKLAIRSSHLSGNVDAVLAKFFLRPPEHLYW